MATSCSKPAQTFPNIDCTALWISSGLDLPRTVGTSRAPVAGRQWPTGISSVFTIRTRHPCTIRTQLALHNGRVSIDASPADGLHRIGGLVTAGASTGNFGIFLVTPAQERSPTL